MTTRPGTRPAAGDICVAVVRSALGTTRLFVSGAFARPAGLIGRRLRSDDGSRSTVFRETALRGRPPSDPVVLVVRFRLRWVGRSRWAHAVFRATCGLSTPLFAGFPGFVTKLWLADPWTGVYRGVYEWDGAERAEWYAARLTRVLALVSVRGSISHVVVEGLDRGRFVDGGLPLPGGTPSERRAS
ncbi:hypothetical protein GCM10010472_22720 [Pseudonocardia halophobica]|uniref:Uncharacterized protein n=1 Tax=Pseudonocardia halophobica TaxID=29401 RepID=A0A9W6NTP9_9PSEU|nr:hypothetical protein [Pseudonocardia halophobica]GLL09505.1 hypothetical protein GCM10017577_06450 [Pseudonocardia halophobica]